MSKKIKGKDYFCSVVSEDVKISLKKNPSVNSQFAEDKLYVCCNQSECQYVDENVPPCPLTLDLFSEEIEEKKEKRKARREEEDYY